VYAAVSNASGLFPTLYLMLIAIFPDETLSGFIFRQLPKKIDMPAKTAINVYLTAEIVYFRL
jgi:hypothetical protein